MTTWVPIVEIRADAFLTPLCKAKVCSEQLERGLSLLIVQGAITRARRLITPDDCANVSLGTRPSTTPVAITSIDATHASADVAETRGFMTLSL